MLCQMLESSKEPAECCASEIYPQKSMRKSERDAEFSKPSLLTGILYLAAVTITSIVVLGMMNNIASTVDYHVDPETCSCDCFDRRFKEKHFSATKQYRHVYFNMTSNTALLFIWSALHLAWLLAFVSRALTCLYNTISGGARPGQLRWHVLLCASLNFYGLVYGWWVVFNYINDAQHWSTMGVLWPTQLFFSLTDLLPAYVGYCLLASDCMLQTTILQTSLSISVTHILLALWDQGAIHILTGHHLAARDLMFFASDLAGILIVAPHLDLKSSERLKQVGLNVSLFGSFYLLLKTYVGSD